MALDERVSTPKPRADADRPTAWMVAAPLVLMTVMLAAVAGKLAGGSTPVLALLIPVLLVPVLVWKRPVIALYVLFAAAMTIEQFGYSVGPREGAATAKIPLFVGLLPAGMNPAEVLLGLGVLVVLMQAVQRRQQWLHRTVVRRLLMAVMAFVVVFLILGILRGGNLNMAMWEVRPFFYLFGTYVLAAALVENFSAVRPLLWILILGSGAKAIYGLTIFWSVRHLEERPESILGHEESFLFGIYIFVTLAMWLFRFRDRLRVVAALLLPMVLACNMVNSRRTAWLILFAGAGVLMTIALVRLKEHRKFVAALIGAAILGASVYLPAFWTKSGTLAQPARAIRSAVAPDTRDTQSNDYRMIEDYNLRFYIGMSGSRGVGFGQPISYFGLVDLLDISPMLAYVPHNGVLYLWWRMGIAGVITFAVFVSQAVISAVRLTAARRRDVGMVGAVVAATVFGYVAMGGLDMGFFWFRNAIVMGTLIGVVDGLARGLHKQEQREEQEAAARNEDSPAAPAARDLTGVPA